MLLRSLSARTAVSLNSELVNPEPRRHPQRPKVKCTDKQWQWQTMTDMQQKCSKISKPVSPLSISFAVCLTAQVLENTVDPCWSCILPFQRLRKGNFRCLAFLRWQLDTLTMFDYLWLSLTWKFLVPSAGALLHQCTMSTSIQAQGLWDRTQDLAVWHRPATVRTCLNTLPYCVAGPRTGMMLKTNRSK